MWMVQTIAATLVGVLLGSTALHVLRSAALRRDVGGELSHAAMAAGMAAMIAPVGQAVPGAIWLGLFAVCGAWSAGRFLRQWGTEARHDAGYHVLAALAMIFMLVLGSNHHAAVPMRPDLPAGIVLAVVSIPALLFAGYFLWHGLRCADRLVEGRAAVEESQSVLLTPPVAAASHLVMAIAMAGMLLGML